MAQFLTIKVTFYDFFCRSNMLTKKACDMAFYFYDGLVNGLSTSDKKEITTTAPALCKMPLSRDQ